MSQERRKHPRFRIDQMIQLSFDREKFMQASGINISEGGIYCTSDESVDMYTKMFIMLECGDDDEMSCIPCEGMVMRVEKGKKGYNIAIEFTAMNDGDKLKLKKFLSDLIK